MREGLTRIGPPGTGPSGTARLGPRPLPLHLAMQLWTGLLSFASWPLLKNVSLAWNPRVAPTAEALCDDLAGISTEAFAAAVDQESRHRVHQYLTGLNRYRHHPYRRLLHDPPAVWAEGTTRLLEYPASPDGVPLLVVPSLINRAYILDFNENRSFMRTMSAWGFRPFLVDWGAPGVVERGFDLTDYIAGRLERVLDQILTWCGRPPAVVGYCMGGLLALALAARRRVDVAALVLLATPWDFQAGLSVRSQQTMMFRSFIENAIAGTGELPVDVLQTLFFSLDPTMGERKFRGFAGLDPASPPALDFVATEDWANDGVALAGPVARECLFGWYGANTPVKGMWQIAGTPIRPESVTAPSLVVVPKRDRIVPPPSALVLADAIPGAYRLVVPAGHIGMMIGSAASSTLYGPLARWLGQVMPG
ncbi:MAG: alpha/beta hydrolase [Alphaproteobacteria bacterium]|nr:alpha/beta hydrolase [Alphaproteobacteria bacterium]